MKTIEEDEKMTETPPKKLLILYILDILQKYTDSDHRLSQKDIREILQKEYHMTVDRKAIRRNLLNLMEYGSEIEYREVSRKDIFQKTTDEALGKISPTESLDKEEENLLWTDFYLKHKFTDEELRLLIDSVLFSKHIPYHQAKDLIEKLESLANIYFVSRLKHIYSVPVDRTDNKQVFYNIGILDEAIQKRRKVSYSGKSCKRVR